MSFFLCLLLSIFITCYLTLKLSSSVYSFFLVYYILLLFLIYFLFFSYFFSFPLPLPCYRRRNRLPCRCIFITIKFRECVTEIDFLDLWPINIDQVFGWTKVVSFHYVTISPAGKMYIDKAVMLDSFYLMLSPSLQLLPCFGDKVERSASFIYKTQTCHFLGYLRSNSILQYP